MERQDGLPRSAQVKEEEADAIGGGRRGTRSRTGQAGLTLALGTLRAVLINDRSYNSSELEQRLERGVDKSEPH